MNSSLHALRRSLAASLFLLAFAGCSSLCDLRDSQTRRPIPAQFDGTDAPVQRHHSLTVPAVLGRVDQVACKGFERFVFAFDSGVPGYWIGYVDGPVTECGSGRTVAVAGEALLKLHFTPAQAHAINSAKSTVRDRDRVLSFPNARQLVDVCDFEGNVEWVLGLRTATGFRVTELNDPPRIVVDVKSR